MRITALLLAGAILCGLTACGEKTAADADQGAASAGARTELYSYAPPAHGTCAMPERLETEEDFRAAWKAVIAAALEPGGTYNGLHLPEMPQGRLRAELQANGHSPEDAGKVVRPVENGQTVTRLQLRYCAADRTVQLTDSAGSFVITFEKAE